MEEPHPAPPDPLAAKKSAKAVKEPKAVVEEEEEDELESLCEELQKLSSSLAAQKGAKARAEARVVAWKAKVDALRAMGGGGEDWAVANLQKAREKVKEKDANI